MTTPKLYHHTFAPWTVGKDGTRVVASESAWSRVLKWDKDAAKAGERIRIKIGVDVFEDCDGRVVDANYDRIYVDRGGRIIRKGGLLPEDRVMSMPDVRGRLFDLIDDTPNIDWMIETAMPENIGRMIPPAVCSRCFGGPCDDHAHVSAVRPNLWLGTPITTQAEADQRIPHLLKCPAAVRYVMLTPREEIDLRPKAPDTYGQLGTCYRGVDPVALTASPDRVLNCFPRIGWAIVSGDTEPLHPDCVRSLRDQCVAAGVPFWFDGTIDGRTWNELPEVGK